MRLNTVTVLHPDGHTPVRVEYMLEPADPSVGLSREQVVIEDVLLETGESIWDHLYGDLEWYEDISKFITDPWYAGSDPTDGAIAPEKEYA